MSAWRFAGTKGDGPCAGQCGVERRRERQVGGSSGHSSVAGTRKSCRDRHRVRPFEKGPCRPQTGPEGPGGSNPRTARIMPWHRGAGKHLESTGTAEMRQERGRALPREGCSRLTGYFGKWQKKTPHNNLSRCKGLWDHPNNLSHSLDA